VSPDFLVFQGMLCCPRNCKDTLEASVETSMQNAYHSTASFVGVCVHMVQPQGWTDGSNKSKLTQSENSAKKYVKIKQKKSD
jgi:hypothetical protein